MRRIDACMNCGETRDMAAHGLCFRCYRSAQRERDGVRQGAEIDRHGPALRREHKRLIKALAQILTGLSDLSVSGEDVMAIRKRLGPYVVSIEPYLRSAADDPEDAIPADQDCRSRANADSVGAETVTHESPVAAGSRPCN